MDLVASSFSELLRRHRLAAGMTQETLAEKAGLSVTGIQKLERGPGHLYRDTVERLIKALHLSAEAQVEFRGAPEDGARQRGDASDRSGRLANLPESLTSFVGRERVLVELSELLRLVKLLPLTGVRGSGNNYLALEVARVVADTYT